jgi:hypothetical protein
MALVLPATKTAVAAFIMTSVPGTSCTPLRRLLEKAKS